MNITSQNGNAMTALPIPNPYCLIIRCTNNPWIVVMKKSGTNVIKMTEQSEYAAALLVIPNLNFNHYQNSHTANKNNIIMIF